MEARAEDGTRTRDPNLGKVMLYQLSYFRIIFRTRSGNINNKMPQNNKQYKTNEYHQVTTKICFAKIAKCRTKSQ